MKLVAGSSKIELSQYIELQSFSEFTSDVGQETLDRLARGSILVEMFKQLTGCPMGLSSQLPIFERNFAELAFSIIRAKFR